MDNDFADEKPSTRAYLKIGCGRFLPSVEASFAAHGSQAPYLTRLLIFVVVVGALTVTAFFYSFLPLWLLIPLLLVQLASGIFVFISRW